MSDIQTFFIIPFNIPLLVLVSYGISDHPYDLHITLDTDVSSAVSDGINAETTMGELQQCSAVRITIFQAMIFKKCLKVRQKLGTRKIFKN